MDLGELCQDRDWALNYFTQCEEVQMAAMSKDSMIASWPCPRFQLCKRSLFIFLNDTLKVCNSFQ